MRKRVLFMLAAGIWTSLASGQVTDAPNTANSSALPSGAAQAGRITENLVNLFTGQASVSVPIYSFSNNSGLATSVSLEYLGGGVQVGESNGVVGLSWFLNAGGSITRIVRGMPDDMTTYGYLYASAIPQDWRSDGNKYYHDSLDAQQDIFQYNFTGHSGKFFIGKNGQIATVPLSKIKIIPAYQTATQYYQTLKSFRIIAEDGVKYDFEDLDHTSISVDPMYGPTPSGYHDVSHSTSWSLTRIISPFSADTIKFTYQNGGGSYGFKLPQIAYVKNSDGTRSIPYLKQGSGNNQSKVIKSIELPDKTIVSFVYSFAAEESGYGQAISKITISDTAFRFGYLLQYDSLRTYWTGGAHGQGQQLTAPSRLRLKSITPFTKHEKQDGYEFSYHELIFPKIGGLYDSIQNKRDYWGFYNGALSQGDTMIPQISPYSWGADRTPNSNATANMLSRFKLPTGGYVSYVYEQNDHYPYTSQNNTVSIAAQTSSQNNITLDQVYNNRHHLVFLLDKSVARTGSAPISGSGDLNIYIKNTAGTVTYLSTTISLYDLFYSGLRTLSFNLDNGTYRLETSLSGGTSITGSLPLDINWENRTLNSGVSADPSGGVRVKWITKHNLYDGLEGSFEEYRYKREDGKSSGFLGDIPRYDFQYRQVVINGGTTTTDYTAICSEPLTNTGFVLGAPVGYNRVEIIKSSYSGSLGKEVREFTDLKDVNSNAFPIAFPYTPQDLRSWGLGIPKRVSVYDSAGVLVSRTVNTIAYDTAVYNNTNFKSLKLGHSLTTVYGDPAYSSTPRTKEYIGEEYYLSSGRAYITSSKDTMYQPNGSINTMYQNMVYDTNYNVTKVTVSYDRTRGLEKEQRMYYPYNYTVGGGVGKLRDSSVISQMIATETWITGDGNPRITEGMVTSFRQIGNNEVKPDTIYSFESNKPIVQGTIGTFDPSKLNRNTTYFKPQSYFTSYDAKGNLSEVKSLVTGLSNSVITDYDQQYAIAKISNAVQADIAYTGFESAGTGNWTVGGTQRDLTDRLTGKKSYNLSNGTVSKSGLSTGKHYLLTLWVKTGATVSVNSVSVSNSIATQHGWNLYSIALTGISSVTISGSGLIDEVRLHPKDANMETHAYEPLIGVISSVDANNTVAHTMYDKLNRVKLIRDKDSNIVKRFDYSDTNMTVNTTPVWVGFAKECSQSVLAGVDSLYSDTNVFSDSAGYVKSVLQTVLDCNCPNVSGNPQYAVINGQCEMGTWAVVSSVAKKCEIGGFLQNAYECTYRYCFSDGSQSTYFLKVCSWTPCSLTCFIDL